MKLEKYLTEMKMPSVPTKDAAFWISPNNEVLFVGYTHIETVISNPKKFGLTRDEIEEVYRAYGETLGTEGKARNDIVTDLVAQGWIRIRQYPRVGWSVNINRMSKKIKDTLSEWANAVLNSNRRIDKYEFVNIIALSDTYKKTLTLSDIANKKLYESGEVSDVVNSLVLVKSATEFTWKKGEDSGQSTTAIQM